MTTVRSSDPSTILSAAVSRRTVLGLLAAGGGAATLLAAGRVRTRAQTQEEANRFVLTGEQTEITYATTSETGEPTLTYRGPMGPGPVGERPIESRTIVGSDIRTERSSLGRLVTVYLDAMPDAATFDLTLLLPEINLAADGAPTPFATLMILTAHLTTIGGPGLIVGALQEYEVVELEGTAELVMP